MPNARIGADFRICANRLFRSAVCAQADCPSLVAIGREGTSQRYFGGNFLTGERIVQILAWYCFEILFPSPFLLAFSKNRYLFPGASASWLNGQKLPLGQTPCSQRISAGLASAPATHGCVDQIARLVAIGLTFPRARCLETRSKVVQEPGVGSGFALNPICCSHSLILSRGRNVA